MGVCQDPKKQLRGFSLVELLTVVAIAATLAGLAAYALVAFGSSALMVSSGELSSLTTLARSTAIGKATIARLCILTNSPVSAADNYRLVSVWSYDRASSETSGKDIWLQETKWQRLPTGIIVDNTYTDSTLPISKNVAGSFSPNLVINTFMYSEGGGPTTVAGVPITAANCCFIEFDGTGGLSDETSGTIGFRLVQGLYSSGSTTPTYTHSATGQPTVPADYGIVTVNALTGSVAMVRK